MKRSPSLVQLSREHHSALVLAKRAQRMHMAKTEDAQRCMTEIVAIFARELEPHFRVEEDALLPALQSVGQIALVERTLADHRVLRTLVDRLAAADASCLHEFGTALAAHVHFEEHQLFPVAESALAPEALAAIERSTQHPVTHQEPVP